MYDFYCKHCRDDTDASRLSASPLATQRTALGIVLVIFFKILALEPLYTFRMACQSTRHYLAQSFSNVSSQLDFLYTIRNSARRLKLFLYDSFH